MLIDELNKSLCLFIKNKYFDPFRVDGHVVSQNKYAETCGLSSSTISKIKKAEGYDIPVSTIYLITEHEGGDLESFFIEFNSTQSNG